MIRPELKHFISRHGWTWGDTTDSPLTLLVMATAATEVSCFKKKQQGRNRLNCTYGGLENAKG